MTIDRLGPIDPFPPVNKPDKGSKPVKNDSADSISVSTQAKEMGEIFQATENIKKSPDIRLDRVEEIKRKLQDPAYIDQKVIESVADKVMELFGL